MTAKPPGTRPAGAPFDSQTLPYGVFSTPGTDPRLGVAVGDHVLDLASLLAASRATGRPEPDLDGRILARPSLDALMAAGPAVWHRTRARLVELLGDRTEADRVRPHLTPAAEVTMHLPFEVADYVDFYSSLDHATNLGRIFRPDQDPLPAAWRHLPVGYHGRAGTVVVSGTPVVRPSGQRRGAGAGGPGFGPSLRLDIEAEVGFVVGVGSELGQPVPTSAFADHVFGVVLVNDWSARDIQAFEYVPLGPFLGKSFATSISAWVVPLEALDRARLASPAQDPEPLAYLRDSEPWGLDLQLEIALDGQVVSRPTFAGMYWTPAQQLAHLTVNGASLRTGDLFASGTVSGPAPDQRGSLIELTWNGTEPLLLADGSTRAFLEDGDTVVISATAPAPGGGRLRLGSVAGTIQPAASHPPAGADPPGRARLPPARTMPAMTTSFAAERAGRVRSAALRIAGLVEPFGDRMTAPDAQTAEQWDRGQVLSHVVELLPYWVDQLDAVVRAGGGVPFGRIKATPSRLDRIERSRHDDPARLLAGMNDGVELVIAFLDRLTEVQLALVGHHQTLGDVAVARAIDQFLVDHLEEHADQLAEQLG